MASKSDHDKPLPTLPKRHEAPKLTTLSVEARNHIRRFILHALEEESSAVAGNDRNYEKEAWTNGILDALDSLGDGIASGGWIVGANRSRRASIQRKLILRDTEEGTTTADAVSEPKSIAASDVPKHTPDLPQPKPPDSTVMDQISFWLSKALPPSPKPYAKHILLTVSGGGHAPDNVSDFELVSPAIGCVFSSSQFMLPHPVPSSEHADHEEGIILYGLNEWDASVQYSDENPIKIVGGNFLLKGVASAAQHAALCKILRLSIYIYLSIVVEQHLFSDSHVKLSIPRVRPRPAPLPIKYSSDQSRTPHVRERSSDRSPQGGVWGFLSKKTEGLLHRATSLARRNSLDIGRTTGDSPRRSVDNSHPRVRRFSFLADSLPWQTKAARETEQHAKDHPFRGTVTRIEAFQDLLSTTAGIHFPPPSLLLSLAEKEDTDPTRRLNPDERIRLHYLLGWEGRDSQGKGMVGIRGFVRQQEFCILYSEHVFTTPVSRAPSVTSTNSETSAADSSSALTHAPNHPAPVPVPVLCGGRRRWMRFRYYSREKGADKTLGGMILRMSTTAEDQCGNTGCQSKRSQHELHFIHAGTQVTVNIYPLEEVVDEERIDMWQSCAECSAKTETVKMSDGSFLLSFGKFLELLVYSHSFHIIAPPLCEHTGPNAKTDGVPSRPGLNIARHFTYRTHRITFTLASVEEIYNVEVPRVQFVYGPRVPEETKPFQGSPTAPLPCTTSAESETDDDMRRMLKREMRAWWHTLSERIDNLEQIFQDDPDPAVPMKSLPRLPSSDDPDEEEETGSDHSSQATPTIAPSTLPRLPSTQESESEADSTEHTPRTHLKSLPSLPGHESGPETPEDPASAIPEKLVSLPTSRPPTERSDSKISAKSASSASTRSLPKIPHGEEVLQLLQNLREDFQREEHSLYSILVKTPNEYLNNVRHAFKTSAKGAAKRMIAWEAKHCAKGTKIISPYPEDPAWWATGNHVIPGSNILINEGDWGSMIAFTLGSGDYMTELARMSAGRKVTLEQPSTPETPISRPSLFSRSSYRLFGPSRQQPDPDDGGVTWEEPEVYSAVVSRKEHPRDPSSLLSIRDVLRKAPVDTTTILTPSRLTGAGLSKAGIPPSAWSAPAVELNTQPADGEVVPPENDGTAGQILHEMEVDGGLSRTNTITEATYGTSTSTSSVFESTIRRGKASSILSSVKSDDPNESVGENNENSADGGPGVVTSEQGDVDPPEVSQKPAKPEASAQPAKPGFSTSIALVMKQILSTGEPTPPPVPRKNYHGLLSPEPAAIDDRPHIKYDWTVGKRLKFSCTVYYAKQFDLLRKRCGIEATYLKSVEKSANWLAEGGKSRSNFWKTADDRFIIKTLVDAWNVADLQVLIELGPSYFKYVESTATNPTVLAKLLGFYTIEIRNIESGTVQAKADLLVMENLFFNKKIAKTFDLKGIQGRKIKATTSELSTKPLFDGDWIEGQQRALTLLHPHSKLVLQEAIKSDSEFLSKSNIMDYSLLLGIDADRKQIACGLVDTIGSYTFAKTLEYKAKQNLKSGKEVTVIPPNEYQARFVNAMDGYFLACPDKWSKAPDDKREHSDPDALRSAF